MTKKITPYAEVDSLIKLTPLMHMTLMKLAYHNTELTMHGLTSQQVRFLMMLHHAGPRRLSDLSKMAVVTPGTLTTGIKKLLSRGLVIKQQDPSDRRVSYLSLSANGKIIVHKILKGFSVLFNSICDNLSIADRKKLIESHEFILETYHKFFFLKEIKKQAIPSVSDLLRSGIDF